MSLPTDLISRLLSPNVGPSKAMISKAMKTERMNNLIKTVL